MAEALVASQLGCFFRRDWATTGVWGILPWMAPQNTQCPLRQALRTKFGALTAEEQAQRQRQQRRAALSLMSPQQRVAVRQRTCSYWLSLSEAEKAAYYARKKIRLANESPETRARRLARRRLREGIPEDETAEARSKLHENQNARMARFRSKEKRILDGYEGTEAERQAIIDKKAAADARAEKKRATETTDDKQARQDNTRLKNERFKATPAYRISEDKRQEKRRAARAESKKARQAQSEATKDARAAVNRANDAARKWEARRVARVAREAAPAAAAATAKANFFKPRTKPPLARRRIREGIPENESPEARAKRGNAYPRRRGGYRCGPPNHPQQEGRLRFPGPPEAQKNSSSHGTNSTILEWQRRATWYKILPNNVAGATLPTSRLGFLEHELGSTIPTV
ncbi:uncharacterized protein EHS24_001320 [Apiotrichum porosum]|uniref:Uncharacterized protein n=1 Tax=Apiotrichum porosum TaxID=105984 RepID=A0A427XK88_9TREE|nr:uncharacterized protein EHS24_001320 [Apiotrichum porosum]RSH79280.1 hypothetical protein EHS24_001320 [Apiotrichum porosum]